MKYKYNFLSLSFLIAVLVFCGLCFGVNGQTAFADGAATCTPVSNGVSVTGVTCTGGNSAVANGVSSSVLSAAKSACEADTATVITNSLGQQQGQCIANEGGTLQYITYCIGNETTGPCAPARIDPAAAAAAAAESQKIDSGPPWNVTDETCSANLNSIPFNDPNTGLTYFYNTVCTTGGSSSSGTGSSSTGNGTGSSSGGAGDGGIGFIVGRSTPEEQQAEAAAQAFAAQTVSSTKQQIAASVQNTIKNLKTSVSYFTQQFGTYAKSLGYNVNLSAVGTTASSGGTTSTCPTALNTDLRLGDSGADVLTLTKTLVAEGLLSAPTSTFDQTVFNAVTAYQEKYAAEILTPLGLSAGTGFVGPSTRAYMNSRCLAGTVSSTSGTSGTSSTSCTSPVITTTKTSSFDYVFTQCGSSSWKVTLDNAALGTPSDFFYIPADYSIIATSSDSLRDQNNYRFNLMSYFPGTPSGNAFYGEVFQAFIRAYYDWDNQTKNSTISTNTNTTTTTTPPPTGTNYLTADGFQSITVNVGDTINYAWGSVGGTGYDSYYSANKADTCTGGFTTQNTTKPWVANTASGSTSAVAQACQAGVTYTITYVIHNMAGIPDTSKIVSVDVVSSGASSVATGFVPAISTPPANSSTVLGDTLSSNYSSVIGVYHWGAQMAATDSAGPIADAVNFAASKGFKIIGLALSPRSSKDYGISSTCDSNSTLSQIAVSDGFPAAFQNPSISTYILTTYDHTTFSDCATQKYLNPSFYTTTNTTAITQEYQDLATYLYQTYKGTNKKFIISNWEGDNTLYCGSGYGYATNASFKSSCDANYASYTNGNTGVDQSITGMINWLVARDQGIKNATALANSQGITGVTVASAGEFNSIRALKGAGFKSMLYNVLPTVGADYNLYSSYESINGQANPGASLVSDLQIAKGVVGNVNVGEFGFDRNQPDTATVTGYLKSVADAIKNAGIQYGIVWQLFDQPGSDFGLFTTTGADSQFGAINGSM